MYAVQPPRYHPGEPNWQDYSRPKSRGIPAHTRKWLLNAGSLTQRLIKASNNQFCVQILNQQWGRVRPSEAALLHMHNREIAIIREVVLLCSNIPWVFARSIFPVSSLTGRLRYLRKLDNRSLGEMLFRDKNMRRYPFQLATIDGNSLHLPKHLRQTQILWGRRCRFELANKPIMVSEIFLHTFCP